MRPQFLAFAAMLSATSAHAWDPNAGAEDTTAPVARYVRQPAATQPRHDFAPVAISSFAAGSPPVVAAATAPAPAPAPRPLVISPLPTVAPAPVAAATPAVIVPPLARNVPVEQATIYTPPPAPVQQAYVPPAPAAPAYVPPPAPIVAAPVNYAPSNESTSYRKNSYSLGLEGFWDRYKEPVADLESNSGYGAVNAGWTHHYTPNWFSRAELRGSYGQENYRSASGTADGIDQWEFEGRLLAGYDRAYASGMHAMPYIGIDTRYYRDEGKGVVTSLGFLGYDRRIFQVMLPIGVSYDIPRANGYHFLPNIEAGPLLYGNVSTRLGTIPGYDNIQTQQRTGYEIRGEFMMSNVNDSGRGWEFGPFARYSHMDDSDTKTIAAGTFLEPKNSRLQVGAKVGYLF